MEAEIPANAGSVDIQKAKVRKEGKDISIITYGPAVYKALEAAEKLSANGIDAEVLDLRILRPMDEASIVASVSKTHRALIVEEGWRSVGVSAEVSSRIMENAFYELDAPVQRFCGTEVPIPYPKLLEDASVPQVDDIINKVRKILNK